VCTRLNQKILCRFVSQYLGVLELANVMRIVEVCFTLHRNDVSSGVNAITRCLLSILFAKTKSAESKTPPHWERVDEAWNRVRALQGQTGPRLRASIATFLHHLYEGEPEEFVDLSQLPQEANDSGEALPDPPTPLASEASSSKLVFPVSLDRTDEKSTGSSRDNRKGAKSFEVIQKKLAGFVQLKQTVRIVLDFDQGTVSFVRLGEKKYKPMDFDRRTLLAIVKNPQNPTELMIHFGPPYIDKRTVMFKNSEDRELFFAAIREGYPLCSTKIHFSESHRRQFSDESRFRSVLRTLNFVICARYVPKKDPMMLVRQDSATSSTSTSATTGEDIEVDTNEIADDDDESLPKVSEICTRR